MKWLSALLVLSLILVGALPVTGLISSWLYTNRDRWTTAQLRFRLALISMAAIAVVFAVFSIFTVYLLAGA